MTVYRLTKYYCGQWHDVKENGETFDYENEQDIKNTLQLVNYRNGYGEPLNYRQVSEAEYKGEILAKAKALTAQEMEG